MFRLKFDMVQPLQNFFENVGLSNPRSSTDEHILTFTNVSTNEFNLFSVNSVHGFFDFIFLWNNFNEGIH